MMMLLLLFAPVIAVCCFCWLLQAYRREIRGSSHVVALLPPELWELIGDLLYGPLSAESPTEIRKQRPVLSSSASSATADAPSKHARGPISPVSSLSSLS